MPGWVAVNRWLKPWRDMRSNATKRLFLCMNSRVSWQRLPRLHRKWCSYLKRCKAIRNRPTGFLGCLHRLYQ